jgi:myo-inositol 2-dehydrogenase/D-chiro-inositol 1-dehydrogenase
MRYGIVGCGMMGQEHIRNIALLAQAEVSAFVEPDAGMAAATQALVPGRATPCPDIPGLLARNDVDALVIASPNHCHVPQLQDIAASAPCRCSWKSRSPRREDDAALRDLARTYPAPIWVAMEYRYMPPIARFRELAARRPAASRC